MVVKSDVEGIMQHFVFSWQMHGGEFDKVEDVASSSVKNMVIQFAVDPVIALINTGRNNRSIGYL